MNDNDVSSYYKEALATDSFTVHNNFLNMLLKDGSALGMERHYCYFKDSENADLKRILGNGFLKRGKEGVLFLKEKLFFILYCTPKVRHKKSNIWGVVHSYLY